MNYKKPTVTVSVVFDIGFLALIALEAASKMEQFSGKKLKSEAVFYNNDETIFDGIKVSTTE